MRLINKLFVIGGVVLAFLLMSSEITKTMAGLLINNSETKNEMEKAKVKYFTVGQGPKKVIATHDWMGDAEGNWKHAIDYLNKDQFTYAFMDVRGYGQSKNVKGDFTIDEIVSDIFDLADELGWERFYLVGHSMNGMASQKAVLEDNDERIIAVVGMTPVSSAGFPVDEDTKKFFELVITDVDKTAAGYGMLVSDKLGHHWNKKRATRFHNSTNKVAVKNYMNEWLTQNFYEEMKGTKKPFLVLFGEDDLPAWREEGQKEAFKHFTNVEIVGIANAGHYPMQQVPAYTVALMEKFIFEN